MAMSPERRDSVSPVGGRPIAHGKISWVQIGMLGSFEARTDDGVLAGVPALARVPVAGCVAFGAARVVYAINRLSGL